MFRILTQWNEKTYGQAFSEIEVTDQNKSIVELLSYVLDKQSLSDKPMNGFSSEGLEQTEKEKLRIAYVKIPGELEETHKWWTPLDILYYVCELAETKNKKFYEKKAKEFKISYKRLVAQICARAVRTLPSWLREQQLKFIMEKEFGRAKIEYSEDLDLTEHCDIKMTLNDRPYYIWSFVLSINSIANFSSKFTNSRYGHVPNGAHIICAFDRKNLNHKAQYKGWDLHSKKYVDEIKTAVYQRKPSEYGYFCENELKKLSSYYRPRVVIKDGDIEVESSVESDNIPVAV